ncbi:hypothetical protein M885DRAFT_618427 [Pelagophyceae sp. CCMP2097]|nr:hypothetical protein M885DRAFT_618427 [Pelagophyceae sp. CCMP2097]
MLQRALGTLRAPQKASVQRRARDVAKAIERHFPRFRFQERGSLWSHHIEHVSDADVQLFTPDGGVSAQEGLGLLKRCTEDHFAYFKEGLAGGGAHNLEAFEAQLRRGGHDSAVCKGLVWCGEFLLPFDVALAGGEDREGAEARLQKICAKAEEGDFAKVLQKVRALLQGKTLKRALTDGVNGRVGRVRFLAKQLAMVRALPAMPPCARAAPFDAVAYARDVLGADVAGEEYVVALADAAEAETQRRALGILLDLRAALADALEQRLGPALGGRFRDATVHL